MKTMKYTSWQDGDFFIGFFNDFSDYLIQGMTREELVEDLKDMLADFESGQIPYARKVEEISIA